MRKIFRHSILDPPFRKSMSNVHIVQLAGSLTGRFLFTEHQPVFQFDAKGYFELKNLYIECAHTAIQVGSQ